MARKDQHVAFLTRGSFFCLVAAAAREAKADPRPIALTLYLTTSQRNTANMAESGKAM